MKIPPPPEVSGPPRGGCLVAAWGPPWTWIPSFSRSEYGAGWGVCWLWFGIYYCPVPAETLMLHGSYPRCQSCWQHADPDDLAWEDVDGELKPVCAGCREELGIKSHLPN